MLQMCLFIKCVDLIVSIALSPTYIDLYHTYYLCHIKGAYFDPQPRPQLFFFKHMEVLVQEIEFMWEVACAVVICSLGEISEKPS